MSLRNFLRNLSQLGKDGKMVVKDTVTVVEKPTVIEKHYHHYDSDKKQIARQDGAVTDNVKELEGIL